MEYYQHCFLSLISTGHFLSDHGIVGIQSSVLLEKIEWLAAVKRHIRIWLDDSPHRSWCCFVANTHVGAVVGVGIPLYEPLQNECTRTPLAEAYTTTHCFNSQAQWHSPIYLCGQQVMLVYRLFCIEHEKDYCLVKNTISIMHQTSPSSQNRGAVVSILETMEQTLIHKYRVFSKQQF